MGNEPFDISQLCSVCCGHLLWGFHGRPGCPGILKDSQAAIKALMCKNASLIAAIKNEMASAFRVLLKWACSFL